MANFQINKIVSSLFLIASFSMLNSCGSTTNPSEFRPYLNKDVVLAHDMALCQTNNWWGTTDYLSSFGKFASCGGWARPIPESAAEFRANPDRWKAWYANTVRTLDIVPKGTRFKILEYTIPSGLSDLSPQASVMIASGPYQGLKVTFLYFDPEKDMIPKVRRPRG